MRTVEDIKAILERADTAVAEPETNEPPECVACNIEFNLPFGYETTGLCDGCAQDILSDLRVLWRTGTVPNSGSPLSPLPPV